MCFNNLPRVALDSGEARIRTRDLLIASPASEPLGYRARQGGRPGKIWKEVMDKELNDMHIKPRDAMDCSKCRQMVRENWSESSNDSDAVS